jgi:hypothetical protein
MIAGEFYVFLVPRVGRTIGAKRRREVGLAIFPREPIGPDEKALHPVCEAGRDIKHRADARLAREAVAARQREAADRGERPQHVAATQTITGH